VLGWLLALYAFTVFGYITATIASLFLARDAATAANQIDGAGEAAGEPDRGPGLAADGHRSDTTRELDALRQEVAALRVQLGTLAEMLARSAPVANRTVEHDDPGWARDVRAVGAPVHPGRADPAGAAVDAPRPVGPHGRATEGG
jgi:hypothetical protein